MTCADCGERLQVGGNALIVEPGKPPRCWPCHLGFTGVRAAARAAIDGLRAPEPRRGTYESPMSPLWRGSPRGGS